MYEKSARLYDLRFSFKDYVAETAQLHELIQKRLPGAKTLLDVACGTGKHMEYLQKYYKVEGLEISRDMIEIAKRRIPGVPIHMGDMIRFDLGRKFDVVTSLFCSIGYVKTLENLKSALHYMAYHLRPGGVCVLEPWLTPESYWIGRVTVNFFEESELKLVEMYISEIEGRVSKFDMHYLVGTPQGVEHFIEKEELGLFTHEEYLASFNEAHMTVDYDPKGLCGYGTYLGVKRS